MIRSMHPFRSAAIAALASSLVVSSASGWDYEGHRIVNRIALAALPPDFPGFVRAPEAAERIAFLSGEPDRWRSTPDLPLKHCASPDHYLDYEQIAMAGLDPVKVPPMRYVFAMDFAAGRKAHEAAFEPINEEKNTARTDEWPGFVPWAITEQYGKLKSGFSYLKAYEALGTPEEVANARANIIYVMGVMGHYVGDTAQPLHMTIHHNGWVGPNPESYTKWAGFHAWIDGGFIAKAGITAEDLVKRAAPARAWTLAPATGKGTDAMFGKVMEYAAAQHPLVERIYALEKAGAFKSEGAEKSVEGRRFIEDRLLTGGQTLATIWITAWKEAGPDTYLMTQLEKRRKGK